MLAIRAFKRRQSVDGEVDAATKAMLAAVGVSERRAEDIYRLTTMPTLEDRFVLPPYRREMSIEELDDPLSFKGSSGFGYLAPPRRGA
jgi:nitrate reductase beta subunit